MADDDLITLAEAAQIIGVSRRSLERWLTAEGDKSHLRPAFRTRGGHRRYHRADALAYRAELERAS